MSRYTVSYVLLDGVERTVSDHDVDLAGALGARDRKADLLRVARQKGVVRVADADDPERGEFDWERFGEMREAGEAHE